MSYVRTPEHRRLRAELIKRWRPWEKSTGPKTTEGKAVVAQNGFRGSPRETLKAAREIDRLILEDDLFWASAKHGYFSKYTGRLRPCHWLNIAPRRLQFSLALGLFLLKPPVEPPLRPPARPPSKHRHPRHRRSDQCVSTVRMPPLSHPEAPD